MSGFAGLLKVEDPRDNLEKAKRPELLAFARRNGVTEITPEMPAILMRKFLRSKNLVNISIPKRVLGQPELRPGALTTATPSPENAVSVDAADDLMRQFKAGASAPLPSPSAEPVKLANKRDEWNAMRQAAKAKGIKLDRKDNFETVAAKLRAHDGQNAT